MASVCRNDCGHASGIDWNSLKIIRSDGPSNLYCVFFQRLFRGCLFYPLDDFSTYWATSGPTLWESGALWPIPIFGGLCCMDRKWETSTYHKTQNMIPFFLASNSDGFTQLHAISKRIETEECAWRQMKGNWKQFPNPTLFFKIGRETAEIWWVKVATIDIS